MPWIFADGRDLGVKVLDAWESGAYPAPGPPDSRWCRRRRWSCRRHRAAPPPSFWSSSGCSGGPIIRLTVCRGPDADDRHGGIVSRGMALIEAVALLSNDGGRPSSPRDPVRSRASSIVDDVIPLPAVVVHLAHAGIEGAVAHGDEDVVRLDLHRGSRWTFLPSMTSSSLGIVDRYCRLAQQDHRGVVELDQGHLVRGCSPMRMTVKVE